MSTDELFIEKERAEIISDRAVGGKLYRGLLLSPNQVEIWPS